MKKAISAKAAVAAVSVFCSLCVAAGVSAVDGRVKTFAPGTNYLDATMQVGLDCAGMVFRSADPSRPAVLSGGRRISKWKVGEDGVWRTVLSEVKAGKWNFSTLYVNGERRMRPCIPATGYNMAVSNAFVSEANNTICGFAFKPGDIPASFANLEDVEVQALHNWNTTRARIAAVDASAALLRFAKPRIGARSRSFTFKDHRYRLENVKEAFRDPGTWYLDRPTGTLSYRPLPGEKPETVEVIAPYLDCIVMVEGADGVRFENIVFAHQNLVTPEEGRFAVQSGWNIPAAVRTRSVKGITFAGCTFEHVDGYALELGEGTLGAMVERCEMRDMGAGGVRTGWFADRPVVEASGTTVYACRVHDGGHIFPEGVGVFIGRSSYNKVLHNEIHHMRYSGVSVGWNWTDKRPSMAHDNEIAYNHIHHIGLGMLSDMGMIYLLGRAPGTTVHDNDLHDIWCFTYGGTGIYPDEGSSELRIWNNIVRNTMRGYHQNYGEDNIVSNNVFAFAGRCQWDCRPKFRYEGTSVTMVNNIFIWKEGMLMQRYNPFASGMPRDAAKTWKPNPGSGYVSDRNVYWNTGDGKVEFMGKRDIAKWREEAGQDKNSVVGDPGFAGDFTAGDCRLKPDSAALRAGFVPFSLR